MSTHWIWEVAMETTEMNKRVALYARVSTHNGQDVGLQLDELRAAATQRGWIVVSEFVDEGVSGASQDRPALNRMLEAARCGRFDVVVVWKLDRLGRSLAHLLQLLDQLQRDGVGFVALRDAGIDTISPQGRLMMQIIGAFAEFERGLITDRVQAGVARAQAAGTHCGRPVTSIDVRPALALLEQGRGLKETATILKVNRNTLRRRLREAGVWPQVPEGSVALDHREASLGPR